MDIIKNVKMLDLLKFEVGQIYYIKYSETCEYLVICTSRLIEKAEFLILHSFSGPVESPFFVIDNIYVPEGYTSLIIKKVGIYRVGDSTVEITHEVPMPLNIYFEEA